MHSLLLLALLARGADVPHDPNALLAKGPLISVERNPDGKLVRCTVMAIIDAPPEKVWAAMLDFEHLKDFMPKVVNSEIVKKTDTEIDVKLEIDTPGTNTKYVMGYVPHKETWTMEAHWVSGDTKGSQWMTELEPLPDGKTLMVYFGASRHFSRVLESLDDEQQTISVGVNVGAALTTVTGLKKRAEGK